MSKSVSKMNAKELAAKHQKMDGTFRTFFKLLFFKNAGESNLIYQDLFVGKRLSDSEARSYLLFLLAYLKKDQLYTTKEKIQNAIRKEAKLLNKLYKEHGLRIFLTTNTNQLSKNVIGLLKKGLLVKDNVRREIEKRPYKSLPIPSKGNLKTYQPESYVIWSEKQGLGGPGTLSLVQIFRALYNFYVGFKIPYISENSQEKMLKFNAYLKKSDDKKMVSALIELMEEMKLNPEFILQAFSEEDVRRAHTLGLKDPPFNEPFYETNYEYTQFNPGMASNIKEMKDDPRIASCIKKLKESGYYD